MKSPVIPGAIAAAGLAAVAAAAQAQTWPAKPIRWISPAAPGGGADFTSRAIAGKLGPALGQQVLVENRGGAGGIVGNEIAARAPADGYTITLGTIGPIAISPSLQRKMPYDPVRDFTAITRAVVAINVLVVHPSLPVKSVKELITLATSRPSQLNFGSSGPGAADHVGGELFNLLAGVKLVHVPYKGGAPAMLDLISGNLQLIFSTVSTAKAAIDSKRIRPIAIAGSQRFELMPDLPTVAEAGLSGFATDNWYGVFVPTGAPNEIVTRLFNEIVRGLSAPDVKSGLLNLGIITAPSASPEDFSKYVVAEIAKWAKVVKAAGITPN